MVDRMDSRVDPSSPSPPYRVRLTAPSEIAAAIPHLLGFRPHESVVVVSLTGPGGRRVGLTIRADLPPPEHAAALAAALTRSIGTDRPSAVLLAVVSEEGDVHGPGGADVPHRALIHELTVALAAAEVPVRDALLVRAGRWWSYDCPHHCCEPGAGAPLPTEVTELEVASVATGVVVARDRGELAARIARVAGESAAAMERTSDRVGDRYCRARLADEAKTAHRSWTEIQRVLGHCRPGPAAAPVALADRDIARVVWGLSDVRVRDRALGLALGPDAAAAEILWTECTRRSPAPLDAAPATLLAVSAWLRGDGAMANVALDRALDSRPTYSLARLLSEALAGCLPPEQLRIAIRESVAELDESTPAS